jgi:uncharacterized phage infection (PIP) family protein YhgE
LVISTLSKINILAGILSFWFLYDRVFKNSDVSATKYYSLFQYTFILYAFHEPLLLIIQKILYFLIGKTEFSSFLIYIVAPIIGIIICIISGFYIQKWFPKFYYLITGGR